MHKILSCSIFETINASSIFFMSIDYPFEKSKVSDSIIPMESTIPSLSISKDIRDGE